MAQKGACFAHFRLLHLFIFHKNIPQSVWQTHFNHSWQLQPWQVEFQTAFDILLATHFSGISRFVYNQVRLNFEPGTISSHQKQLNEENYLFIYFYFLVSRRTWGEVTCAAVGRFSENWKHFRHPISVLVVVDFCSRNKCLETAGGRGKVWRRCPRPPGQLMGAEATCCPKQAVLTAINLSLRHNYVWYS